MKELHKIAIANRGEVAVRIIHACKELGLQTVLLHSEADFNSLAYRLADEKICIGGNSPAESYLNIENTIDGVLASGAEAVHPGFGFLSENANFARACRDNNILFIGPTPESIEVMGDKVKAKELIAKVGIPTIPGYSGDDQSEARLTEECKRIGFPVIIKAAFGGGGRGMKIIKTVEEAADLIASAKRESHSAFGSEKVFLEKYLDRAKHIEVQVFGDLLGNAVHLYDRECSVQRRHQKVIEESLGSNLSENLRQSLCQAAVRLTEESKYLGAGTVEFLVQDEKFYFMEMNTRLQVEHTVTEQVMGVDLVKAQILIVNGEMALWEQEDLKPRGHAIECRLCAEDPFTPGIPSLGEIGFQKWPEGPGIRVDYGFESGDEITSHYDSMIAKIIVWDETRPRAIRKMLKVLDETIIFGVKTNIPFLKSILIHPEFISAEMTTGFIAKYFPNGIHKMALSEDQLNLSQQLKDLVAVGIGGSDFTKNSPWNASWSNS